MKAKTAHSLERQIVDPNAIAFLTNPEQQKHLQPFLQADCLIKDAARELKISPNLMYRRVQKLLALGLIYPSRTQTRAGKTLQYYRATGNAFVILLQDVSLEQMLGVAQQHYSQQFLTTMMQQLFHHPEVFKEGSVRVGLDARGNIELSMNFPDQNKLLEMGVIGLFAALSLSPADHQALQVELLAVVQRFSKRQNNQRAKSLLFVGLTPKP